jgi:pimeloyl-ACP methyl ester carboxylesterase
MPGVLVRMSASPSPRGPLFAASGRVFPVGPYHAWVHAAQLGVKPNRRRITISRTLALPDGRALHVREWHGPGQPLVLLHGLLDSSAGWTALAHASRRPCLAVDLPGFGHSDPPRRARLDAYADDVVHALVQVGVGSCTLVGHSLGGGVATAVAERMGVRVGSLVLSAPVGFGRLPLAELAALPLVRNIADAVLPHIVARPLLLASVYASLVTNGVGPTDELARRLVADAKRVGPGVRAALEALVGAGRSATGFHRRRVAYGGPVSVVWGDRDALVPLAHAQAILKALPQARLHVWPGMGHHPQRERPHELAKLVEASA